MRRLSYLALAVVVFALSPAPATANGHTQLAAAAGTAQAKFGISVSISGDTAVVGAPDEGGVGAAYVFTKQDGGWIQQATLVSPQPVENGKFGFGVSVDGDTIVVGEPKSEQELPGPGGAYVFARAGYRWIQQAKLTPSDTRADDSFGFKVAVSGETVVVGAKGSGMAPTPNTGAAYVFTRSASTWSEQVRLVPSDGGVNDAFGYSVAISRDTIVVGAPGGGLGISVDEGAAYVFTRYESAWSEHAKLVAADGAATDGFGDQVAVSGDTVVVGADFDSAGPNAAQGSAHVFVRNGASWTHQAKLTAPDGAAVDMFGRSVSVDRDTVVVGAQWDEPAGAQLLDNHGSVFVFKRAGGEWSQPTTFTVEGTGSLGVSVAISGHTMLAGAPFTKVGDNAAQGAAYVFDLRKPTPVAVAGTSESRRSPINRLG
ncbi:MAG TPA: FG-GAP repeat protein [Acidimicrobiales bacterium]|nr:FG-GAP repeat protein [Acidimicrobiales bacterium]